MDRVKAVDTEVIILQRYLRSEELTNEILDSFDKAVGCIGGDVLTGQNRWLLLSSFYVEPVSYNVSLLMLLFKHVEEAEGQQELLI